VPFLVENILDHDHVRPSLRFPESLSCAALI
jgi:hypothetical protein